MIGLPSLATFFTAISSIAVLSGLISLLWNREISVRSAWGRIFIFTAIVSCITAFGLYLSGPLGIPHILGIATLILLRAGTAAGQRQFGAVSPYLEAIAFSASFFLHLVLALIEVPSRLPVKMPVALTPGSPAFLAVIAGCAGLFAIIALLQMVRVRKLRPKSETSLSSIAAGSGMSSPA